MKVSGLGCLSLCSGLATAFRDTSPFFAFSSSELPERSTASHKSETVSLGSSIPHGLDHLSIECPSRAYIFVHQPGVASKDFKRKTSAPHLRRHIQDSKDSWIIPEVVGRVDLGGLKQQLVERCHAHPSKLSFEDGVLGEYDERPQVIEIDFPELPIDKRDRASSLVDRDSFLNIVINSLDTELYTVVYTTTPAPVDAQAAAGREEHPHLFEWEDQPFGQAMHTDLKRDLDEHAPILRRQRSSGNDSRGLFERYKYVNDGIFHGGIAVIIFISILYVGISAVSGIEISYMSFSKEMSPANQKKQQQGGGGGGGQN